jgi:hypothetical protein
MVKIQLTTGYLDVKEGTAFPLNFQVGDIRDISKRQGNFSKTITLPGTKVNNNLLNHYYDINIVEGTFNINAITICSVIQDGIPIMEDATMQLTSIKKVQLTDGYEEHVDYEVLIKDSKADFFTAITNKELTAIDFSDFNHTYDATNVVSRFSNTVVDGFKYFLPGSGDAVYNTQEFKPAIFAKVYFDRIFADAGFQYDWPSLSYDRFDKLIIPYNGGVDNQDNQDFIVKAEITTPLTINGNINNGGSSYIGIPPSSIAIPPTVIDFTNWTELEDLQNIFNPITGVYSTPFIISSQNGQSYDYNITMSYQLNLVNTSGGTLYASNNLSAAAPVFYKPAFGVSDNTQAIIFKNIYTNAAPPAGFTGAANAVQCPLTIPNGTTNILTQTIQTSVGLSYPLLNNLSLATLGLNVEQVYLTSNGGTYSPRFWRTVSVSGPAPTTGDILIQAVITSISLSILPSSNVIAIPGIIDVNDYVPKKIKQSDFIKGIFNMYNLYASVDSTQPNKLLLQSRDDFYDIGVEVDWTDKLAKDDEQNLSFLPEITAKKVILTYAPDKDPPNTTYSNATNNIYGQAEVIFDNEYVKEVATQAILFSPTPVIKTLFGAFVPMIAGSAPETNIRILYDKTEVGQPLATCGQFYIYDYGSIGMINQTSYPLVGHFDDPLTPTFDINFAICDYYYYQPTSLTSNNLYNRYWRRTMGQINNGKMLTAMFNLKENDIQRLQLNDKIRIDNSWWNINKVIDYDANANKLTKVELISVDNEINFTRFMGPSGPDVPDPIPGIGPIQVIATSHINIKKIQNSNVFSNQATATVMGRGNVIVGGTRSVIVGDDRIISEDTLAADSLMVSSLNGVPTGIVPKIYIANLTQAGITDPIVQVKNDSLGGVTWTRTGVGTYEGYLDAYEPLLISSSNVPSIIINNVAYDGVVSATYTVSSNTISVTTSQIGVGFADGYLTDTTIEVKYYT